MAEMIQYLYRNLYKNKIYIGVGFNLPFFDTSAPLSSFCASSILSKKNKEDFTNQFIMYKQEYGQTSILLINSP